MLKQGDIGVARGHKCSILNVEEETGWVQVKLRDTPKDKIETLWVEMKEFSPTPIEQNKNTGYAEHQQHYQNAAMQPIEVMQRIMSHEAFLGFLYGNFIKYRLRRGFKGDTSSAEQDEQKAKQYYYWWTLAKSGEIIKPIGNSCHNDEGIA